MDMSRPERCLLGSSDRKLHGPGFTAAFGSSRRRDYAGILRKSKPRRRSSGMLRATLYIYAICIYRSPDIAAFGGRLSLI